MVDSRNKVYDSRGNALVEKATDKLISGFRKSRIMEGVREIGPKAFVGTVFSSAALHTEKRYQSESVRFCGL